MPLFPGWQFDAVIAVIIAAVPLYVVELWVKRKKLALGSMRPFFAVLAVVFWLAVVYGSFIAPRFLTVKEYPVALGETGAHLRVAIVSDMHFGPYKGLAWAEKVVRATNDAQPDLIILDGDLVTTAAGTAAFSAFRGFRAPLGVWAVLGNYDYRVGAVTVRERLGSVGVKTLVNRAIQLPDVVEDHPQTWLIGIDDMEYGHDDWDKALAGVPDNAFRIVVAHSPDAVRTAEVNNVQLLIAGHTHGGQIRLPLVGPIARLPISIGQEYDQGLFRYGRTQLFITPGVGESGPRARLFSRPEISVLDVTY
ncbi:MAG: metallophosphoesterase [Patescibacteria group bacterium]|nr:metallophosphoesterase [Patescibacteria group bacterium]